MVLGSSNKNAKLHVEILQIEVVFCVSAVVIVQKLVFRSI